jgi:hypothetical protein
MGGRLYIATQIVGDAPIKDNKLVERIVDQKLSLDIVTRLLDEHKGNPDIDGLIVQINDLKATFDKISIKSGKIEPVYDENTKVTTLKSKSEITITPEVFKELNDKVKVLRSNFII